MFEWRNFLVIFLVGLFWTCSRCEGRAVNISNTWTLPQDGFAVFYRFFRDKISWFEADAVCQFHHANLVTVDNGQQFDAAREFLKVLDVTDTVWIGLMRPQNSERFTWSNSKPLASTSGYWAESLPLIESPLCAVIDPVRDFRWHALRCGGPETASFLCEMNVPSWALECTIPGMSNLTTQYMADNGSVELTRDCGGDEIIHQICKGKQDHQRIANELACKSERIAFHENLVATHHRSLDMINKISSDNDEDNNIHFEVEVKEETKKEPETNPVQKLIEQFNVEELMQADQPQEILPKPAKKAPKKAKINEKKEKSINKQKSGKEKQRPANIEELMMGDQPSPDVNQIQEPLPHIKKSFPQDLKQHEFHFPTTTGTSTTREQIYAERTESSSQRFFEETSSSLYTSPSTENVDTSVSPTFTTELITEKTNDHATSLETAQQSQATDEPAHAAHPKEHTDNHFIPPMLLVKSHYTSLKPHPEGELVVNANVKVESTTLNHDITSQTTFGSTMNGNNSTQHSTTLITDNTKVANTTFEPSQSFHSQQQHQIVEIKIGSSANPSVFSITTRPATTASTSPNTGDSIVSNPSTEADSNVHSSPSASSPVPEQLQSTLAHNEIPAAVVNSNLDNASPPTDTKQTPSKNKFSNEENYQPYRPNRRRSLTKPETTNYLKKILG